MPTKRNRDNKFKKLDEKKRKKDLKYYKSLISCKDSKKKEKLIKNHKRMEKEYYRQLVNVGKRNNDFFISKKGKTNKKRKRF